MRARHSRGARDGGCEQLVGVAYLVVTGVSGSFFGLGGSIALMVAAVIGIAGAFREGRGALTTVRFAHKQIVYCRVGRLTRTAWPRSTR